MSDYSADSIKVLEGLEPVRERPGQLKEKKSPMTKIKNETGQTYNRLQVIQSDPSHPGYWICKCKCGTIKSVYGGVLRNGSTKSCGCLLRESVSKRQKTHGLSRHPLYHIWACMKDRCENSKSKPYPRYGGRLIDICSEWQNPVNFILWCLENKWKKGIQIDRINNDLGYSPDNCRLVTSKTNNQNRHNTKLTIEAAQQIRKLWTTKNHSMTEIARQFQIHRRTVSDVIHNKTW